MSSTHALSTLRALCSQRLGADAVSITASGSSVQKGESLVDTLNTLAAMKPDAIVMHPGPMNRGVEITSGVADDPQRSAITEQVEMGVAVRMACLDVLTRRSRGVEGWA